MVRAIVREWHDDLGWGVLDSVETPGGCWAHFSVIVTPVVSASTGWSESDYKGLRAGQLVELEWETPGQHGFDFTATSVRAVE